jgi:hypothetical protein
MEFTGRLAAFPAANLLQWAAQERATGTLVLRRSSVEKRVGVQSGHVVECRSNQPRELFGRFLLDHEHVGVEDLARGLRLGRETGLPLGWALVEAGVLAEGTVRDLLYRWLCESVQDLFLWHRGVFFFEDTAPRANPMRVELEARELLLEGTHWIDEHSRLRRILPDDGVVLKPGPAWPGEGLPPFDSRVARGCAPEAALDALRGTVGGVDFPFLAAVARLIADGVLVIDRHVPVETRSSRELRVADLLAELDAQEGGARVRGETAIVPMDVFEALVPAWIQAPASGELETLSPSLRAFLEAFDARTSLRRLLAREEELQTDQLDLLLLHLRRRNVILLPAAIEDVERRLAGGSPLKGLVRRIRG